MDVATVWRTIDHQRAELADLAEDLSPGEWRTPSLCADWRVGDVIAHLTLAQMGIPAAALGLLRARGRFDRMIRDTALRQSALPVDEHPRRLRAMVGSRRTAPGVTPMEPLIDVLVHGQDITLPLGRTRHVPPDAAAAAAARVWSMGFPFHARRRLHGSRLAATDVDWTVGEGPLVEGPVAALLLLVTGRPAALPSLRGDGVPALTARLGAGPAPMPRSGG